jgi:multidrug resistance efflux pump
VINELERLKRLLDEGAITREEYERLKKRLLEEYTGVAT